MSQAITHPLPLHTVVHALKPSCPCRGAKMVPVEGSITKVINNAAGVWYYLSIGVTIKADWIQYVVS